MQESWSNRVGRSVPDPAAARTAARTWWDEQAPAYLLEHGGFLGAERFVWGPEGLTEEVAGLLGDVRGRAVLEVGAGALQCSRWLAAHGALPVGLDLSAGMLIEGVRAGARVPVVQADAAALPFADAAFDLACSSYGAVPFVPDVGAVHREVARVLRPGGRWVFSTTHPVRWAFPDDPGPRGLTADRSYFDRTPYVERDEDGAVTYVEYHRTLEDHVAAVTASGLLLERVVEPRWRAGAQVWGGWSRLRGERLPGTVVLVCRRP